MYPFTLSTTRFEHSIWDLPSSFPGGKRAIYTFRQDDGLSKRGFAFPAHLTVRRGSNLSTIVSERGAKEGRKRRTRRTSYHLDPSAQILINFSLNSSVCLSIVLRSNFAAGILTSDSSDMIESLCCFGSLLFLPKLFQTFAKDFWVRKSDYRKIRRAANCIGKYITNKLVAIIDCYVTCHIGAANGHTTSSGYQSGGGVFRINPALHSL